MFLFKKGLIKLTVKSYIGKIILLFILLLFLISTCAGCAVDPMVSYLEEIEEKEILADLEQMEVDVSSLYNEVDILFLEQLEDLNIEGVEAFREQISTFIDQQADLIAKVSALETGSEEVEDANNYLLEALKNQKNALNMLQTMIDYSIELIPIMEDPGHPDAKDDLDRIIAGVEEAEIKIDEYISVSDDALEAWELIVEGD